MTSVSTGTWQSSFGIGGRLTSTETQTPIPFWSFFSAAIVRFLRFLIFDFLSCDSSLSGGAIFYIFSCVVDLSVCLRVFPPPPLSSLFFKNKFHTLSLDLPSLDPPFSQTTLHWTPWSPVHRKQRHPEEQEGPPLQFSFHIYFFSSSFSKNIV